ncbi:MAG: hypothetical protein VX730_07415 [Pseudomonadota bacterium]|nr:hypothetical protein [Pseudomonadota bacterium]
MGMIDKLKSLAKLRTGKSITVEPDVEHTSVNFPEGMDPVSLELNEQRELLKAFYKHKIKESLYQHHLKKEAEKI